MPFKNGNRLGHGGARPDTGRNYQLSKEQHKEIRKLWPDTVVKAFRKFHKWMSEDPQGCDTMGEARSRSLEDAWRVIAKHLPPMKPEDVPTGDGPAQLILVLREYKSNGNSSSLPTPFAGEKSVLELSSTSGNGSALPNSPDAGIQVSKTVLLEPSATTEENPSSSPSQEAGTLDAIRAQDR